MKKIGSRNIKTALAVVISYIIVRAFTQDVNIFAPIAAVMTMQNTVYSSFKNGLSRVIGTTMGAIIATIAVMLSPNIYMNCLMLFLGTILLIYMCNVFNVRNSIGIACVVFMFITIYASHINPIEYSAKRLLETFVGIAVALIINSIVNPNESTKMMYTHYDRLKVQIQEIFSNIIKDNDNPRLFSLRDNISTFKGIFSSYQFAHMDDTDYEEELELLNNRIKLLREANVLLKLLYDMKENCSLTEGNYLRLKDSGYDINLDICPMIPMDDQENIVFNYHVNRLIDLMEKL